MLLPKAMVISRSLLLLRAMSGSVVLLQPKSVLIFMACGTIEGHVDVSGLLCSLRSLLVSPGCGATSSHIDVNGPCCAST